MSKRSRPSQRGPLPYIEPGKAYPSFLSASYANRIVWALNALLTAKIVRGDSDELKVSRDGNIILQLSDHTEASSGSGVAGQRYKITAVNTDYLTCRTYDGSTTGGTDIYVAYPDELRGSAPITNAEIRKPYAVNDEIWAIEPDGGTGQATATDWIDINCDARKWCMELDVCISNVTYQFWIPCFEDP